MRRLRRYSTVVEQLLNDIEAIC